MDILVDRLLKAARHTGLATIVAGGGVAANSYLRRRLAEERGLRVDLSLPEAVHGQRGHGRGPGLPPAGRGPDATGWS